MKMLARSNVDPVAELKLAIIRQQELAARLFREGDQEGARQARTKLFNMTNRLEVMEEMLQMQRDAPTLEPMALAMSGSMPQPAYASGK